MLRVISAIIAHKKVMHISFHTFRICVFILTSLEATSEVRELSFFTGRGCGSPPGVIVADTLSFNAKMDLVDF